MFLPDLIKEPVTAGGYKKLFMKERSRSGGWRLSLWIYLGRQGNNKKELDFFDANSFFDRCDVGPSGPITLFLLTTVLAMGLWDF